MLSKGWTLVKQLDDEDIYFHRDEKASAIGFEFNGKYFVYVEWLFEEYENNYQEDENEEDETPL